MMAFYRDFWTVLFTDMGLPCKILLALFLILALYFSLFGKGFERWYFGIQGLFLAVLLFNPVVMYMISRYADLAGRYFRFLWLLPVGSVLGWSVIRITNRVKESRRDLVCYILSAAILASGALILVSSTDRLSTGLADNTGLVPVSNKYRIEDDTLAVCTIIERDKEDPKKEAKVLYGYQMFLDIRTYDASVYSELTFSDQGRWKDAVLSDDELNKLYDEGKGQDLLAYLINAGQADGTVGFPSEKVYAALQECGYQYVIVQSGLPSEQLFLACGDVIGKSDHYTVIRVTDRQEDR